MSLTSKPARLSRTRVAQRTESRQIKLMNFTAHKFSSSAMSRTMRTLITAGEVKNRACANRYGAKAQTRSLAFLCFMRVGGQLQKRPKTRWRHVCFGVIRPAITRESRMSRLVFRIHPADGKRFVVGDRQKIGNKIRVESKSTYCRAHSAS